MSSYGIGITRAVAALAEQTYDEKGLCWPRVVAPADVHLPLTKLIIRPRPGSDTVQPLDSGIFSFTRNLAGGMSLRNLLPAAVREEPRDAS